MRKYQFLKKGKRIFPGGWPSREEVAERWAQMSFSAQPFRCGETAAEAARPTAIAQIMRA
ncbi:hypothetical protein [Bradyrhizobium sp. STM 3557]|uniref:hypothetical protein n=1 Tax=Bradyrhizobium sp. STM 3557 TaxID=578920 RepID=UPI00388D337D